MPKPAPAWAKISIGACLVILVGVYLLPDAAELDPDADLATFGRASHEDRSALVEALAAGEETDTVSLIVTCVDSIAPTKNSDIQVSTVVGWCQAERQNNPERFASHVSTIGDRNLSTPATVVCRNALRAEVDQGALDFPWVPDFAEMIDKDTYHVTSQIEATGPGGATGKMVYSCEARYSGAGDVLEPGSWQILALSIEDAA